MKLTKSVAIILLNCLLCCSCFGMESESNSLNETSQCENTGMNENDMYNKSLTEDQRKLLSGVVTLELLESIVGELTYEYTPIRSAYTTEVYKGVNGIKYELEFLSTADGTDEIVACICHMEGDSEWMFCKAKSIQYGILRKQEGGISWSNN